MSLKYKLYFPVGKGVGGVGYKMCLIFFVLS